MPKKHHLFLDTSALLSGLNSPFGASAMIIALFKLKRIDISISPEVIIEAQRTIRTIFTNLHPSFTNFLTYHPYVTKPITEKELTNAYQVIPTEDAPIFAGMLKSPSDTLITLDKRFQQIVKEKTVTNVLAPGEFVAIWRKNND